ncbi:hypothetical protein D0N87_10120 [Pseudomonas sp. ATCC 13867]|nr:hypothetical protein D0N87_10120 [Pseudomonas sp. ATCC 13867]
MARNGATSGRSGVSQDAGNQLAMKVAAVSAGRQGIDWRTPSIYQRSADKADGRGLQGGRQSAIICE